MDNRNVASNGCMGRLPASAPLANPYVPFQMEDPPKYELKTAIVRGTLFPGLDLPFMNMINKKELPTTPLSELQTMAFGLNELALYLDTHRNDKEAFEVFDTLRKLYVKGREKYEKEYGPLTHMSSMETRYAWLDDAWPWEYAANREG